MSTKKIEKAVHQLVREANPYAGREGLIYVRVSSKKQELEGHGRQSQEERCKQDFLSIGVPHLRTFPDTFTGGGDFMNRPAMRALLAYIDAHPHKKFVVIFDDLKRFARDTAFHLKLRTELKVRDVLPRCLNYNFDDSPEGMFVETVLAAGNELERHQNRRQVVQKMKARLDAGYWSFAGRRGYDTMKDLLHGKLHVANKDGRLMKEALEGFASGNFVRKIDVARFLFSHKFWKNAKASPEDYIDTVTAMLTDVFHAGYIEYEPWGVARRKGHHKGIISLDTYEVIQKRLKKEDSHSRVRMDISPEFPLRGLVLCPSCQEKLTGAPCKGRSKTYAYYYCVTKGCSLRSKMLSKKDVEREYAALLRRTRLKDELDELVQLTFNRAWKQEVVDFKRLEALKARQRSELEEKLRDLTELARTTRLDTVRRAYEQQIEETARELEGSSNSTKRDLGVPYRTALAKSTGLLKNPITIWEKVGAVEKQRLYFFLFEARLPYTKGEGFRTGELLSSTRIFEEFCEQNSDDVDRTGFEPATPSLQMRCSTN